jgi:hypothetical protein
MADTRGKIASNAYLVSFLVYQKLIDVQLNSGRNERKILLPIFSHTCVILTQHGLEKSLLHNGRCAITAVAPGVSHALSTPSSGKQAR